ncbi:MAG: response regulator [Deltaproteobacteria bacterium]|nr:response regulator [Deltaproteobacteria bacterium]
MAHVLLIDDDADLVSVNRTVLEALGHRVSVAYSGQEAWDHLATLAPDVLVLDCMMEEFTSGFELAQEIARVYPRLPIIMLTAVSEQMSKAWTFSPEEDKDWLPVARFLEKPVTGEDLDGEIRELLEQVSSASSKHGT